MVILFVVYWPRIAVIGFFLFKRYQSPSETIAFIHNDISKQSRVEVVATHHVRADNIAGRRVAEKSSIDGSIIRSMIPVDLGLMGEGSISFADGVRIHSDTGMVVLLCTAGHGESRAMVIGYDGYFLGRFFPSMCFHVKQRGKIDVYQVIEMLKE